MALSPEAVDVEERKLAVIYKWIAEKLNQHWWLDGVLAISVVSLLVALIRVDLSQANNRWLATLSSIYIFAYLYFLFNSYIIRMSTTQKRLLCLP